MQISIISTVPELHQVGLPRNLIISYIIYHHFRKVITILNLYFWWWEPNCAWFCFSLYIPDLMQTNRHQANNYIDPKNQTISILPCSYCFTTYWACSFAKYIINTPEAYAHWYSKNIQSHVVLKTICWSPEIGDGEIERERNQFYILNICPNISKNIINI